MNRRKLETEFVTENRQEMEDSAGNWCLIESDPGVFSEMLKNFGVENVQVEEIYSLDADQFRDLKPVYGLIFLFKWVKDENPQGSLVKDSRIQEIFFAKQVISRNWGKNPQNIQKFTF